MPTPFDTTTPVTTALADNHLGPTASFLFRKYWKEEGMPTSSGDPITIDYWYEQLRYGRVDREGVIVYPTFSHCKQLPTTGNDTYWALDFVVDAFSDFRAHFAQALEQGTILKSPESNISEIEVARAWVSANTNYHEYMKQMYNYLVTFWFQKEQRNLKIKNFSDFLHEFMELVGDESHTLPFTKSQYILSRYFSPMCSGLAIEVVPGDHSLDIIKEKMWVQDPNFSFYRNSAAAFGFFIDKNAPWRLVADVDSTVMTKYMEPYGINPDSLFERYYYHCHLMDIEVLKRHLIEMYNAYAIAYPKAKILKTKVQGYGNVKTVSKLITRELVNLQNVNRQFPPEFWLKTYYYIRLREMGARWDAVDFNKKLRRILQQYKLFDFEHALSYTNNIIRSLKVR